MKRVPDAVNPDQLGALPSIQAVILPSFALPDPVEIFLLLPASVNLRDRSPPPRSLRLYLAHQSLLM